MKTSLRMNKHDPRPRMTPGWSQLTPGWHQNKCIQVHITLSLPPNLSIMDIYYVHCAYHWTGFATYQQSDSTLWVSWRFDWAGQGDAGKIFTHKGPMSWDPRIYKSTQPTHPLCHCPLSSNPSSQSQIKAEPKCPYFGDNLLIWSRDRITNDNGSTHPSPSPTKLRDDATLLLYVIKLYTLTSWNKLKIHWNWKHIFIYLICTITALSDFLLITITWIINSW